MNRKIFMRRAGSILPPLLRKGGAFYAKGCKTLYAHIRTSNILCVYLGLYHSFYHGNLAFIL